MPLPFEDASSPTALIAYTDGGARGNPGPAGFGVRIEREDGTVIEEISEAIGIATNNVAEYRGLLAALEWARKHGHRRFHVRSDSELLVQQMLGRYKVKSAGLQPLHRRAQELARAIGRVTFEHVVRAKNAHADRLANAAMDEAAERSVESGERAPTHAAEMSRSPFSPLERATRLFIFRHFVETASAPSMDAMMSETRASRLAVEAALLKLADGHAIVLAPATRTIWMAHPFSAVPTPYPVVMNGRTYYANCAWDAAGVLSIVGGDGDVRTRCADCGAETAMSVRDGRLLGEGVVHFAVPPRRFWENVAFT